MIAWLAETLFAVTLLMLLVLAVRRPVAHFFGAGWAYALWLLPALRLVLPPLHLFGADAPSLLPRLSAAPAASAEVLAVPIEAPVEAFQWEPVLLAVWAAGTAFFILWQAWSYFAFLRRLGIGSQVHASLAQDIGIIESREVEGPLAIGLLDKWIVVPADFTSRYSEEEQRLALQHERIHHQREDIFWNMVALAVLALNWFNPVAYAAFRAFRSDQELSCDAAVAARASVADRHDYARALVKSASRPGIIAACPLNHAGQLKRRLRMMKAHRRSRLRALGGSSAVAALLLAGISVTETPGVAAPEAAPVPLPAPVLRP
ncbi:MAG TPA: M56 family metallopeptidase [Allosphingosinicella sp.]|nr:M56 family metallopeptidase [Allosphingosinicella sp.]